MKRLAAIAVAFTFAACGGSEIDGAELEDEITRDAAGKGIVLDAVDCPSPETEEGATFTCTVTVKGEENELEITQRDDDANVTYDFTGLVEGPAVNDMAADEASIESVVDALHADITALCDYATPEYRAQLTRNETCAEKVLERYPYKLLSEYEISVNGDNAAAADDRNTVTFERQKNGSWLITNVK